jgi:hypothetical protein
MILGKIPDIINIAFLSLFLVNRSKLSAQKLTKLKSILAMSTTQAQTIADWINLGVVLLSKNSTESNEVVYIEYIQKSLLSLNQYFEETGKLSVNTKLQEDFFMAIIGFCKGDFGFVSIIASQHGFFEHDKVKEMLNIFSKFQQTIFGKKSYGLPQLSKGFKTALFAHQGDIIDELDMSGTVKLVAEGGKDALNQAKDKASGIARSTAESGGAMMTDLLYRDLFKMFDKDDSGYIAYGEFKDLCKYMGLTLDEEKSLKMFAMADRNNNNCIETQEFKYVMLIIQLEIARDTLNKLEITTTDLIMFGVLTFIYLVLILAFVFLGIFAFSKAEGFNSVVNSFLPLISGVFAGSRKIDIKGKVEKVKEYIKSIISNVKGKSK